jgi:glycosyltransferase involved in cell wall biosynthesis
MKKSNNEVKIDVLVLTYNHEDYITECLNSILNQKQITFINLIILNDGSADNTESKILEFIQNNSKVENIKIKYVSNIKNQLGSGEYNPIKAASEFFSHEYFAILEGDDFWIDDKKLYNQYLLMEENLDMVGCHSLALRSRESQKDLYEQTFDLIPAKNTRKAIYTIRDFIYENGVISGTVLLRRKPFELIKNYLEKTQPGDWFLFSLMAQYGHFILYNKVTTLYRIHNSNFWATQSPEYRIKSSMEMLQHLGILIVNYDDEIAKSLELKKTTLESFSNSNLNVPKDSFFKKIMFSSKFIYLCFLFIFGVFNLKFCPICQNTFKSFRPLDKKFTENLIKYGWDLPFEDSEMCNVSEYHCPNCDASDRDRFYSHWLLLNRKKLKLKTFLDIAPNPSLTSFILQFIKPNTYLTIDLFADDVDINIDIQDMNIFPDGVFDFILCSHVLEHVTDDKVAMREIYRISRSNSVSLLIVPISLSLKLTREDTSIDDPAQRWKLFGQDDHVRHYAKLDFINRVKDANYKLELYDKSKSSNFIYKVLGLSITSTLYLASKRT